METPEELARALFSDESDGTYIEMPKRDLVEIIAGGIRSGIAAERAACANVARDHGTVTPGCQVCNGIMSRIAAAIEARGN